MIFKASKNKIAHSPAGYQNPAAQAASAEVSVISVDVEVEGIFSTAGEVHILGIVRGTVRARICLIEANGMVQGEIDADDVVVQGRVEGPIRAGRVHLCPGCHVEGDVYSGSIAIDHGAVMFGSVRHLGELTPDDRTRNVPSPDMAESGFPDFGAASNQDEPQDTWRPLRTVRPA